MTVLEVLQSTALYFQKHDVESPRLNAEHLLAHVLSCKRMALYLEFERVLLETELAPLRELVRRRGQGEPLQHLLGTVEFCGLTFLCDRRALVPRPETEELIQHLLKSEVGSRNSEILDVGTGSGVIALSLAAQLPETRIRGVDLSDEALTLARENAVRLCLADRVQFSQSDLLQAVDGTFDLIVANLPYVSTRDRPTLSREVLMDPELAVFGGEAGDEIIRQLIIAAPAHLKPGGLLALEIGLGQSEVLVAFLAEKNFHDIAAIQDYARVMRFLFARYG